jgi:hypothetical protein
MGNSPSNLNNSKKEYDSFYDVVDYIATYYILTMDFKSLSKLSEKAYCDKLVILTSDIIDRYFNDMEVTYLAQRIKNGVEVNSLNTGKVIFINKDNLDSLDVSNDTQKSIRKKRVCIGIAKFYVKIAHIFAAIVMTINPVYTYKDPTGQTVKAGLLQKDKIPKGVNRKLYKLNICDNRIRSLKRGEEYDTVNGNVSIQPRICDINISKNGVEKTLSDEPGITELMRLYLDDNYDYSTGTFTGMSKPTKDQFLKDLRLFYTAFTGNETMPAEYTKFSDIKLREYSKKPGCQPETPTLKMKYTLNKKDKLMVDYAENIKNMIQNAADNQYKLLSVINDLFTYVIDPYTGKKVIRISPKLNDTLLQKNVVKTRRLIVDLYVKCEKDYVNGIKLFEAIVESKILSTTQNQIETLKKQSNKIITDTKKASAPVIEKPLIRPQFKSSTNFNSSESIPSSSDTSIPSSTSSDTSIPSSTSTDTSIDTSTSTDTSIPSSTDTSTSTDTSIPSSTSTSLDASIPLPTDTFIPSSTSTSTSTSTPPSTSTDSLTSTLYTTNLTPPTESGVTLNTENSLPSSAVSLPITKPNIPPNQVKPIL